MSGAGVMNILNEKSAAVKKAMGSPKGGSA
jgi:hypothetical protein